MGTKKVVYLQPKETKIDSYGQKFKRFTWKTGSK